MIISRYFMNIIVKVGGVGTSVGKILGIYMNRRLLYLLEAVAGMSFLVLSGIFFQGNFFLKMIQPGLYMESADFSVKGVWNRITDGLSAGMFPVWKYVQNIYPDKGTSVTELYPSDNILAQMTAENEQAKSQTETEADSGADTKDEGEDTEVAANAPVADSAGVRYTADMLQDYSFFVNQFFAIDSSTVAPDGLLNAEQFMNMDLSIDIAGEEPKVLIYHTHSQETFADSRPGYWQDSVVGLGDTLKNELESRYGIAVYHLTDTFDVIDGVTDRSAAYTYAEERVREVLAQYPSIKVVIDLHRDGVAEGTRLVTEVNGKPTAQIMFLDGLCRTTSGPIEYLQNPYLAENLAFSFQLQLKAEEYYPDFARRIYLRAYQYNLHILPRALLVECGAQTNTVEEVQNAMPLLADLLYLVLSGS